jgi:hypothetical protein
LIGSQERLGSRLTVQLRNHDACCTERCAYRSAKYVGLASCPVNQWQRDQGSPFRCDAYHPVSKYDLNVFIHAVLVKNTGWLVLTDAHFCIARCEISVPFSGHRCFTLFAALFRSTGPCIGPVLGPSHVCIVGISRWVDFGYVFRRFPDMLLFFYCFWDVYMALTGCSTESVDPLALPIGDALTLIAQLDGNERFKDLSKLLNSVRIRTLAALLDCGQKEWAEAKEAALTPQEAVTIVDLEGAVKSLPQLINKRDRPAALDPKLIGPFLARGAC